MTDKPPDSGQEMPKIAEPVDREKKDLHDIIAVDGQEKYESHLKVAAEHALSRMQGDARPDYEEILDDSASRGSDKTKDRGPGR